jgi:NDP-sugar pyrophosphorylase family protein
MKAVILAGGKGRRLQPYTTVIPKPLMPIGDLPILEIILRQLKSYGVDEVILAVGYMSQLFQAFFQNGERYNLKISYSFEMEPLGTAGPLANIIDTLSENFILMNGDLLTTLNYQNLFNFHVDHQAAGTIGLYQRDVIIDFGVVEETEDHQLSHYTEKPTMCYKVSMGVNAFNRDMVKPYLSPGKYLDLPDLMMRMKQDGLPVFCYHEECYWLDIGRMDDYDVANQIFESRRSEFIKDV